MLHARDYALFSLVQLPLHLIKLVVFLLLTGGAFVSSSAADGPHQVLLIHSFGRDFAPFDEVAGQFRTELARRGGKAVEFTEASLELARFDGVDRDAPLLDFLTAVFKDRQPDLVVPVGAPALQFCTRHRTKLFPGAPMLALGVDKRRTTLISGGEDAFAVVGVDLDLVSLLKNVLDVLPETREIHMALGTSPLERFWESELKKEWEEEAARHSGLKFYWMSNLPLEDMTARVAKLPSDAVVFAGVLNRDARGVPLMMESGLESLRSASRVPVFGFSEQQLGMGIVGGRLTPMRQVGIKGAEAAARLLGGTPARDVPPVFLPMNQPVYDGRELKRWRIAESRLPAGSAVLFREPTLWQTHRTTVLIVTGVIAVQWLLITLLLAARRRARELDASLSEQRRELAHLSRATTLSTLSGSLAHELNQPLGIILSNAQAAEALLEQPSPDLAEIRSILADIVKADHRAGEVIKRLRAFLRRGELNRQPQSVNELVEDVLLLAKGDLVSRNVEVETSLAPDLPSVSCDRVQLQQVLLNLIMNACDAMNGTMTGPRMIRISTGHDAGRVSISVRDTGCGLPEDVEGIFKPFVTSKQHGLGLGLAISRSIVEAHAGRLWAEGLKNGAIFHCELPVAEVKS